MGDTDVNVVTGRHGQQLTPDGGYTLIFHKSSTSLYTQAVDAAWVKYRAVVLAAREGDDAALDAAGIAAWGSTWWNNQVVAAGRRDSARYQLARFLPLGIPVP